MFFGAKEEQRYGRNKSTIISKRRIESGKYRKKFDTISSDKDLNRLIYGLAKKMLYHRSGTRLEDMYWIDINSLEIICEVIDSTEESKILYPPHVEKSIRKYNSLVAMHSHPCGNPPSLADFNSAYRNGYLFGVIVGHNGNVYLYSSNQEIPKDTYEFLRAEYYKRYKDEYSSQIYAIKELAKKYDILFKEVL